MRVAVVVVVDGWRPGGSGGGEAEMERECPLPPIRTLTMTTDTVVKVS